MKKDANDHASTSATALRAAGDNVLADDVQGLEQTADAVDAKLGSSTVALVERLIFGPSPKWEELTQGGRTAAALATERHPVVAAALEVLDRGEAFDESGKLSDRLRDALIPHKAHAFTVPEQFGGAGKSYAELGVVLEQLSANGLGALAVELSGQLTIGAGSLLGYGSEEQRAKFLPALAQGRLMGFALTEVGVGVNAKKIQAYVEPCSTGGWTLHATGPRNKLWITSARHGGILGLVARIGKEGKELGLFVIEVPEQDAEDGSFWLKPSGVDAFHQNYNSRIHFDGFHIPEANKIPADGVEVLFYCLRLGRCMLAAMASGYQRMLAKDSLDFARARSSLGGIVSRHELPRWAMLEMSGNALQSYALSHLSLAQDTAGVNLAGLRDLTKSAAAATSVASMIHAEHVMGGRAFTQTHRVNQSRANLHLFGIVEGEDNMIRMGMVRDLTANFSKTYLSDLLGIMAAKQQAGAPLRLTASSVWREPGRVLSLASAMLRSPAFWKLKVWGVRNLFSDACAWFSKPPVGGESGQLIQYATRRLRLVKWRYLGLTLLYQLELTRAQKPLVELGEEIEHLVSMIAVLAHVPPDNPTDQALAVFQAKQLKLRYKKLRCGAGDVASQRAIVDNLGEQMHAGEADWLSDIRSVELPISWQEPK